MTANTSPDTPQANATLQRRRMLCGALAWAVPAAGQAQAAAPKPLQVGGLPVTWNLTLPVACVARATTNAADAAAGGGSGFKHQFE